MLKRQKLRRRALGDSDAVGDIFSPLNMQPLEPRVDEMSERKKKAFGVN